MTKDSGMTRRQFLKASALAGAGVLLPPDSGGTRTAAPLGLAAPRAVPLNPAALARFVDPLPIPPRWTAGQLRTRGLVMAESTHQFHSQMGTTRTWGYGGASYLGPTIEAVRGTPISFTARNRLGAHILGVDEALHGPDMASDEQSPRVSLHLHGGYTEPRSDGYPEDTFTPGQDYQYRYANDQQAGTTWYHDHALGITRLNVYAGLAGFYLIRDQAAEAGLPPEPFEIPLAIQDRSFLASGDGTNPLYYPDPWAPEFFGDVAVVNGKAWPNLDVARGLYRFRLLNGSSSRFYNLKLSPRLPLYQIGTDTGLLEAPVTLANIILAPGERADVLIDFSDRAPGEKIRFKNAPLPPEIVSPADVALPEIMQFTVAKRAGFRGRIPAALVPFSRLSTDQAVAQRNLLLVEIVDPDSGEPVMALLNNRHWTTDDVETPRVNTVEQWNIINLTMDTHPIHLHLVQLQILNRQPIDAEAYLEDVFGVSELTPAHAGHGDRPFRSADSYISGAQTGPAPYENGWKDTVQAHPGMVTRILVPFGPDAAPGVPFGQGRRGDPFTGEYVWHCHILDHEDNEMMLPYRVIP